MKKTIIAVVCALGSSVAIASSGWESKYWDYANSMGDATPLSMHEWGVRNGYIKDNSLPERIKLSKEDQEYIAYANSYGDGTPKSFHEWKNPTKSVGPRKQLTQEDVEYIRFANSYGDSTPPSFYDWKKSRGEVK